MGRLGWIDGYGFSPYEEDLVFDGEETFRTRFESIQEKGSRQAWLDCVRSVRAGKTPGNVVARIVLAASFASVLVKPCSCLPFFVHLWGGSETGKSLSLVLAASVWANPEIGVYIQTFNATEVGKELGAAFCNSLPLVIDELQLVKDNRKDFDKMIYQLSEGVGRARGQKQGGLQKTPTWRNCIITTGEFPIISSNSGEGAVKMCIRDSQRTARDSVCELRCGPCRDSAGQHHHDRAQRRNAVSAGGRYRPCYPGKQAGHCGTRSPGGFIFGRENG